MAFVRVASLADIPDGKMKQVIANGKEIVVAHTDGEFLAFDASCTHQHCGLAGGFLDGYTLTCYCHGAAFDISTGEVLAPPATEPLGIYPVRQSDGHIEVDV